MESNLQLLKYGFSLLLICLTVTIQAQTTTYDFTLNGASEVPPSSSSGSGSGTLTLNNSTNDWTLSGTVSGLTGNVTAGHIHLGAVGSNGVVITSLMVTTGGTSATITGSGTFTAGEVTTLNASGFYVNVHTTDVASGEVRGQIMPTPPDPIPTMSQWGVLIFGLLVMNLGLSAVRRRELI